MSHYIGNNPESIIDGFEGFITHPSYKDFSLPTFDGMHNIIKGGSWVSTGNLSLTDARYAFRRHFYQFCGFRCVQGEVEKKDDVIIERLTDVTKWISSEYEIEMYERFKIKPRFILKDCSGFNSVSIKSSEFSSKYERLSEVKI